MFKRVKTGIAGAPGQGAPAPVEKLYDPQTFDANLEPKPKPNPYPEGYGFGDEEYPDVNRMEPETLHFYHQWNPASADYEGEDEIEPGEDEQWQHDIVPFPRGVHLNDSKQLFTNYYGAHDDYSRARYRPADYAQYVRCNGDERTGQQRDPQYKPPKPPLSLADEHDWYQRLDQTVRQQFDQLHPKHPLRAASPAPSAPTPAPKQVQKPVAPKPVAPKRPRKPNVPG